MLVLERGDDDIEQIIEEDDFLRKYKTSFIKLQNIEKINLSSTEIRDKVKRGESVTDLVPFEIMDKVIKLYK